MKTQVMTFRISNSFEEWAKNFDSHLEIQKWENYRENTSYDI